MLLHRLRTGLARDIVAAIVLALVVLGGVVQARAATEKAVGSGFAGTFELCLQSVHDSLPTNPHGEHCDDCRVGGSPASLAAEPRKVVVCARLLAYLAPGRGGHADLIRLIDPVSRGPPA